MFTASLTPIARQSFGGYVDSELRYNYSLSPVSARAVFSEAPRRHGAGVDEFDRRDQQRGDGNLATGRLFTIFGSRLTLDAAKIDSQSAARSTQLRAYDDLSYQFNQKFAGLARLGYDKLDYPLQPGASSNGPSWALGGRYTPFPGSYLIANYGRQEGLLGFTGALRYEITPVTVASASFTRNRASQQQQILNNLNSSAVDINGNLVDQVTGLPTRPGKPAIRIVE